MNEGLRILEEKVAIQRRLTAEKEGWSGDLPVDFVGQMTLPDRNGESRIIPLTPFPEQDLNLPPLKEGENHIPRHEEYDALQQGQMVSLNQIIRENPMMFFAVQQQINRGSVLITGFRQDEETGEIDYSILKMPIEANRNIPPYEEVEQEQPFTEGVNYDIFQQ